MAQSRFGIQSLLNAGGSWFPIAAKYAHMLQYANYGPCLQGKLELRWEQGTQPEQFSLCQAAQPLYEGHKMDGGSLLLVRTWLAV